MARQGTTTQGRHRRTLENFRYLDILSRTFFPTLPTSDPSVMFAMAHIDHVVSHGHGRCTVLRRPAPRRHLQQRTGAAKEIEAQLSSRHSVSLSPWSGHEPSMHEEKNHDIDAQQMVNRSFLTGRILPRKYGKRLAIQLRVRTTHLPSAT